jgi:hypothetical protein
MGFADADLVVEVRDAQLKLLLWSDTPQLGDRNGPHELPKRCVTASTVELTCPTMSGGAVAIF